MAVAGLSHARMELGSTSSAALPCSSSSCCRPGQQVPTPASTCPPQSRRTTATLKGAKNGPLPPHLAARLLQRTTPGFPGACVICRRGQGMHSPFSSSSSSSPSPSSLSSFPSTSGEGPLYSGLDHLYRSVNPPFDAWEDGCAVGQQRRTSRRFLSSDIRPHASVKVAESSSSSSSDLLDVPLESDLGVCYKALRDRLSAGEWEEADNETRRLLCVLAGEGAVQRKWVYFTEVKFFPVKDLQTVDNLWVACSGGRYGYSVQRKIWMSVNQRWKTFFKKVGWTTGENNSFRKFPLDFMWNNDSETTPEGHLPLTNALRGTQLLEALLKHPAFEKADESSKLMDESELVAQVFSEEGGVGGTPDLSSDPALSTDSTTTPSSPEKSLKNLGLPPELRDVDYSF